MSLRKSSTEGPTNSIDTNYLEVKINLVKKQTCRENNFYSSQTCHPLWLTGQGRESELFMHQLIKYVAWITKEQCKELL